MLLQSQLIEAQFLLREANLKAAGLALKQIVESTDDNDPVRGHAHLLLATARFDRGLTREAAEAGLAGKVEVRYQDYRDVDDGPYDAISSIGMFEHVGLRQLAVYFERCFELLPPGGRLLNHAISRPPSVNGSTADGRARFARRSFIDRYVFPDGELHEVGSVVSAIQRAGLEARHMETLREHYALTLRAWVANLEANWDACVTEVGEPTAAEMARAEAVADRIRAGVVERAI